MTVKTNIAQTDLSLISSLYDINFTRYSPIESGTENSNFILYDDKDKKHIMTIFEDRIDDYGIEFCLKYQDFLSEKGLGAPTVYKNNKSDITSPIFNKKFAILKFIEGVQKEFDELAQEDIFNLGKKVASIHVESKDFPMTRENGLFIDFCKNTISTLDWSSIPESQLIAVKTMEKIISSKLENTFNTLPAGIVHTDLFEDNVFFKAKEDSEVVALIDFYFSCSGFLVFDIAVALIAICFSEYGCFYPERLVSLVRGYCSVRKLEDVERSVLVEMSLVASLRFICSRSISYLTPNTKTKSPLGCTLKAEFLLLHGDQVNDAINLALGTE